MENKEVWIVVLVLGAVLLFNNNYATGRAAIGGPGIYEGRFAPIQPARTISVQPYEGRYDRTPQYVQPSREIVGGASGNDFLPYRYEPGASPTGSDYAPPRLRGGSGQYAGQPLAGQQYVQYPTHMADTSDIRRYPGEGILGVKNTGSLPR